MLRPVIAVIGFLLSSILVITGWRYGPVTRYGKPVFTPEHEAYRSVCSTCHPPPDPKLRKKSEWRGVVSQMHLRMTDRELNVDQKTLELAVQYLEQNGR
ncbi:MAG: hypothetical protein U1E76_00245 [Planctomycetota bacterium]